MSSLRSQDRVSLCRFTFADGRQCRTPRQSGHLQFCCFHARKQAQSQAAEDIGRDISYFFSGRYLSACDLNAALGRLFAATAQGHIKRKTAATLAYLAQVMVQCIQLSQHEYAGAFGGDGWRGTIRTSVKANSDYLHPPQPGQQPPNPAPQPVAPKPPAAPPPPAPSPQAPLPPTRTEFVQQVLSGLETGEHARLRTGESVVAGLQTGKNVKAARNSSRPPQASRQPSPEPHNPQPAPPTPPQPSAQPNPPSASVGAGFSPSPAAAPHPPQQPPEPHPSVAATPSASTQEPRPSVGPQTGPSAASGPTPPPLPSGFGAPANWDVLIPSKPVPSRRRKRHWPS
jgi:hypothetical protein